MVIRKKEIGVHIRLKTKVMIICSIFIVPISVSVLCFSAHLKSEKTIGSIVQVNPLIINEQNMIEETVIKVEKTDDEIAREVQELQTKTNISTGEAIAIVAYEDDDYIDLLARLVTSEVGILNDEAHMIAASVVMNRVANNKFPNSIYGVIYEHGQFAVVDNGTINNPPTEQAYRNAKFVYENGSQCPSNVVYQARFTQGSGTYKEIDGEYFCYE